MSPESIAQTVTAVLASLAALIGVVSRRRRLRNEIRENITMLQEMQKDEVLREHTPACGWLQGKIALDVAKLTGVPLGAPKKPIPKGSVVFAAIFAAGFFFLTYYIDRNGFVWYSVFPGIISFLLIVSILGMTTNRELPTEATGDLPPGAVPIRTDTASERIASAAAVASSGEVDDRFSPSGQVGVAFKFLEAMRDGQFEHGLAYADKNWQLCRMQAWLWNNQDKFGSDISRLQDLAEGLLARREPRDVWEGFVATEAMHFAEAWQQLTPDRVGAASRRRRIARDYELVILVPVGESGGYFVTTATALPNALTFVMHHVNGRWLIANHIGTAPPVAGWPPAWWAISDPAIEALSDEGS